MRASGSPEDRCGRVFRECENERSAKEERNGQRQRKKREWQK